METGGKGHGLRLLGAPWLSVFLSPIPPMISTLTSVASSCSLQSHSSLPEEPTTSDIVNGYFLADFSRTALSNRNRI